jgi:hypothetical protein
VGIVLLALVAPSITANTPWLVDVLVLCALAAPVALMIAYTAQFKRVSLLAPCLVVSDEKREAHIPLSEIVRVKQTVRPNVSLWRPDPDVILVEFRDPSPFGRRIVFVAATGTLPFQENPVVARLREACMQHSNLVCPHAPSSTLPYPSS